MLSCTIASTPRGYDRGSGQWKDGATLFQWAVVYGPQAEHVDESFSRSTRVIAHGKLTQREFETREGDKRTVTELVVDEIGASARYTTLTVKKARRGGGPAEPGYDPWSTPWTDDETASTGAR